MGMSKKDLFKAILSGAAAFIPGGAGVQKGIEKLIEAKKDTDDADDVDEIADAISEIAIGSLAAVEGLTERDIVNDPVLAQLAENIKGDLKLARLVLVRKAAPPPTP